MNAAPARLTLDGWDRRHEELLRAGLREPAYGGPLRRHVADGDFRLLHLLFDNSAASLRLWNFLLTENDRLHEVRRRGFKLVGAMKDLGTVPVMACSLPNLTAFYPDGAWWTPCVMELSDRLLAVADALGVNETFCPVRAMLGAFVTGGHFPRPDLLVCSAGAVCDDFSAIAQRLNGLGHPILWWEIPHRRAPEPGEAALQLPGGFAATRAQRDFVEGELRRVADALGGLAGAPLDEPLLRAGIARANVVRRTLAALREEVYTAPAAPLPSLEMLVAEMLAIHFCSDLEESIAVLGELLGEARTRRAAGVAVLPAEAVRVFWVNPVADLRAMNLLEECGGRVCGTEYMFSHALDGIPEDLPPFAALAGMALADPMAGPAADRAARIVRDAARFGAEAVVVSRIPGASHCASEGRQIGATVVEQLGLPWVEIEVPPLSEAVSASLRTRLEALVETAKGRRSRRPCATQG